MSTAPQRATLAELLACSGKVDARLSDAERTGIQQHLDAMRAAATVTRRRKPALGEPIDGATDQLLCAPTGD